MCIEYAGLCPLSIYTAEASNWLHSPGLKIVEQKLQIYGLPLAKRFRAKGYQENDKTVAMAPLRFLNEDVETAGSTKDIKVYYINPDSHPISKLIYVYTSHANQPRLLHTNIIRLKL